MKRLLNTLYVTTDGAYLRLIGETVCVRIEKENRLRVPLHTLSGIVCIGRVGCSPQLMGACGERGLNISFLSPNGRFLARVQGPVSGNILLRREQFRRSENPERRAMLAQRFVQAKIANSRNVLLRAAREYPGTHPEALDSAIQHLSNILNQLQDAASLDRIRGLEGDAARTYFSVFDYLITHQKEAFFFHGRSRRPPMDNMNALLSFLYTLLAHDAAAALESFGLDPAAGFLHCDRPGRPGLALDLMEELRPGLADRLALSLINRKQLQKQNFTQTESGAVRMNDVARKTLLTAYQKRKQEEITHPFLNEKIPLGLIPLVQAQLLSRHIRGDLSDYPPFVWR